MLQAPGKDSEVCMENFEKAVLMMTVAISDWIEAELTDSQATRNGELLIHSTDHLRQYGITGAHVAGLVTLSVASLWAQNKTRLGHIEDFDLKKHMSWVMQSPASISAIQETFKILDESDKHEAENFVRGSETFINTFVKCILDKFSLKLGNVNQNFVAKNDVDLRDLQKFFQGLDEAGLAYVAKVLELAIPALMSRDIFENEFIASYSDYYSCTVDLFNDIFELE